MIFYDKIQTILSDGSKIFNLKFDQENSRLYSTISTVNSEGIETEDASTTQYYLSGTKATESVPIANEATVKDAQYIVLGDSIYPTKDNTVTLGSDEKRFKKIFCTHLYIGTGNTEFTLPTTTTYDSILSKSFILDKTTRYWKIEGNDSAFTIQYNSNTSGTADWKEIFSAGADGITYSKPVTYGSLATKNLIASSITINGQGTAADKSSVPANEMIINGTLSCKSLKVNGQQLFASTLMQPEIKIAKNATATISGVDLTTYTLRTYLIRGDACSIFVNSYGACNNKTLYLNWENGTTSTFTVTDNGTSFTVTNNNWGNFYITIWGYAL